MGTVVATASQPAVAAIKLAWWREALEKLDREPAPAEPRLQAAAAQLLPRGISGTDVAELEQHWSALLQPAELELFMPGVAGRADTLFGLAARLLGVPWDSRVENASRSFVTVDLARRGIWDLVPLDLPRPRRSVPRRDRPLTAFYALARRDMQSGGPPFEPEATPARAWALLRHRLTGR